MTKNDIVNEITRKTGVEQIKVRQIVQLTLDAIVDVLVTENRLELRDFGVFEVREVKARKARNPRTGVEVSVPGRKRVAFKAGKIMETRVNGQATHPPSADSQSSRHESDPAV